MKKSGVGKVVLSKVKFYSTVAEIVRETGAKPNTVRVVLRRASVKGLIHLEKFVAGKGARRLKAICHDDGIENRLDSLICSWCGKEAK